MLQFYCFKIRDVDRCLGIWIGDHWMRTNLGFKAEVYAALAAPQLAQFIFTKLLGRPVKPDGPEFDGRRSPCTPTEKDDQAGRSRERCCRAPASEASDEDRR